jgi:hypothetical protein
VDGYLGQLVADRNGDPRPPAQVVDRLTRGDGQEPAAEVRAVAQPRVGAQRRQPGLLVAVIGLEAADTGHQEAVDVAAVRIQQGLEGRKAHFR